MVPGFDCYGAGDFGAGRPWTFTCPSGEVMLGLRIERATTEDLDYEWGIRCVAARRISGWLAGWPAGRLAGWLAGWLAAV